jgi:hypothetical protein
MAAEKTFSRINARESNDRESMAFSGRCVAATKTCEQCTVNTLGFLVGGGLFAPSTYPVAR